jgi:guanosine-diphosphatase
MHSEKSIMTQRSRLVKAGLIIAGAFLFLLYLVPSRQSVPNLSGAVSDTTDSSTAKCTKPHDPSKPLRQYVLMIDAGSTGSRIHVYRFNNCGPTPELEDEVFKMTPKKEGGSGLSSYKEDAEGAAKSLDVLMDVAMESVPDEYKSCTPVSVKATAGLRLLGEDLSKNILQAVRHRLETVYPFPVVSDEKGGIQILDGSDEGVYAWITTNYLLGKIGGPDETPTAAVFDLGGASTQIVFQPTFDSPSGGMPEKLAPGDHKYELQFGGREFDLYQHSHLGYGLMEARSAVHKSIIEAKLATSPTDLSWLNRPISNPCIGPGMERQVNLTFSEGHALAPKISVTMTGPKELSAPAQCRGITEKILHKEAGCKLAPCSFNGVHQPSLEKTFAKEDVYIFSYFYDRTKPLGMPDSFTLHELQRLAEIVCGGQDNWGIFEGIEGALEELEGRPESCLDLNFMLGLLHTGYEMPLSREVKIAKKIKNNELGWCLGASLPLLSQESGWTCRIKEVS